MKTKTFLPVFTGFYNTLFEFDFEPTDNNGKEIAYEDLKIDYKRYEQDVAQECCEAITELIPFVKSIGFESVQSPKEYNFKNDSINCTIDFDAKELKAWIYANQEFVTGYIEDEYSSRSGFIPFYSNKFEDWEHKTGNFTNWSVDGHRLGAILNAYCQWEEYETSDLHGDIWLQINEHEYVTELSISVDELDSFEAKELSKTLINGLNDDDLFGYAEIAAKECKEYAELHITENWKDVMCEKYPTEVLVAYTRKNGALEVRPHSLDIIEN